MSVQHHIIVCDDEADLRELIGEYLTKRGYHVRLAEDAAALMRCLDEPPAVDAVLLDIKMPGESGLVALGRLATDRTFAVIMVTAAGETIDRIMGLELGADDYLPKPVDLRELEARIRAAIRRKERLKRAGDTPEAAADGVLRFAGLHLDIAQARLTRESGEEIPLTAMEFQLLRVFAEHKGRVLNRDQLLELAHDRDWDPYDRSIDIRISRLRRKIEPNPTKPVIVRTVRGIGYLFDPAAVPEQ